MSEFVTELQARAGEAAIRVPDSSALKLEAHYKLLVRWNKVLNLTRVVELKEAITRHYCESLFLGEQLGRLPGLGKGTVIIDAGSGGGFPGVPIAAVRPEFRILLVESHNRKGAFLAEATRGWGNARVLPKRLEDLDTPADVLVTRAVAWRDIRDSALSLTGGVGLLVSRADAESIRLDDAFDWLDPINTPWNSDGVALLGVKHQASQ
jgi:16S rRNA (guanine527-N7)-methyltransferase